VRHSDAIRFCEWLTNREASEWKYRLPTQAGGDFPLKTIGTDPLGYWIGERYKFAWVKPILEDIRRFVAAIDRDLAWVRAIAIDYEHANAIDLDLDRDHDRDHAGALNDALVPARNRALAVAGNRHRNPDRNIDPNRAFDIYIDIFLLRERIGGHFPAFEGIRLVKERLE
jgi:hypothetical protein